MGSEKPVALLPCPGCGKERTRVIGGPGTAGGPKYWCGCDLCRWRTWGDTEAEAIAAWNSRPPAPEPTRPADGLAARLLNGPYTIDRTTGEILELKQAAAHIARTEALLEEVRGALDTAEQTLDQILDDMRGDGQCVCLAVKKEAIKTLASIRTTLAKLEAGNG